MANHCENVLRVSGKHDELIRFDEKFRNGKENIVENYSFSNLYPVPELSVSEKCDWCNRHWSVKGNFFEETFERDILSSGETEIYYYFDTPWVAPENLILHTSAEFSLLEFMLISYEPGNKIQSLNVYREGRLVSEEELSDADIAYWFGTDESESA